MTRGMFWRPTWDGGPIPVEVVSNFAPMTGREYERQFPGDRLAQSTKGNRTLTTILEQPHMFDAALATVVRDEAIARVEDNAEPDWVLEALRAIYRICQTRDTFTTDRVWAILDSRSIPGPHEPKALGAVIRTAQRRGWCRPTPEYTQSVRVECHRRPLRVWQSAGPLLASWDGES